MEKYAKIFCDIFARVSIKNLFSPYFPFEPFFLSFMNKNVLDLGGSERYGQVRNLYSLL